METLPDRALVLRTRRGEVEAFGELVRRYQAPVFNVCYRMLGERREAEDLAQEAFVRAYQRLDTFDAARPFGPWLSRVAVNLCLNALARTPPPQAPLDEELDRPALAGPVDPETAVLQREQRDEVRSALLRLPAAYRAVIELRHFQEMSYAEISDALAIPLSDVKSHLFRGRRMLAELLRLDVETESRAP